MREFVQSNKARYATLGQSSKLKQGTLLVLPGWIDPVQVERDDQIGAICRFYEIRMRNHAYDGNKIRTQKLRVGNTHELHIPMEAELNAKIESVLAMAEGGRNTTLSGRNTALSGRNTALNLAMAEGGRNTTLNLTLKPKPKPNHGRTRKNSSDTTLC